MWMSIILEYLVT